MDHSHTYKFHRKRNQALLYLLIVQCSPCRQDPRYKVTDGPTDAEFPSCESLKLTIARFGWLVE